MIYAEDKHEAVSLLAELLGYEAPTKNQFK
jgi:hypothetical protein